MARILAENTRGEVMKLLSALAKLIVSIGSAPIVLIEKIQEETEKL